jgi:signal transduction histidine kinase
MSSPSEPNEPRLLESIKGKITLANLASVLVLLVVGVIATVQLRALGRLLNAVSDDAAVLMHLSHAYDHRDQLVTSFKKGYGDAEHGNPDSQVRFRAIADDVRSHTRAAQAKLGGGAALLLGKADATIQTSVRRVDGLERLSADEREVVAIEIEEALADSGGLIAEAKLGSSRTLERRLGGVQQALLEPQRLFWLAAAIGGLIALGVSFFLRARVSRPIENLSLAVAALARGEPTPVSGIGRDEIGRLGAAFNGMAETITERTRSLRLVLDNVGDGLLTVDLEGNVDGKPSNKALAWFGPVNPGTRVADYLFGDDERLREWFVLGFDQLVSGILTFDEAVAQIPAEVRHGERTFGVTLRPVVIDDVLARVLVVVTDVTEKRRLAHQEREARDVYHLASVALREPEAFTEFVSDTERRLARATAGSDILLELHTIKGNASVMGCDYFSSQVHDTESRQVERVLDAEDLNELTKHWRELVAAAEAAVGRTVHSALVVPRREYERLCALLAARREKDAQLLASSWSMQRMDTIFERLSRTAEQYAARVGKQVTVESDGGALAVPRGPLDELWSSLVHLVKNTVAHGVERTEGRVARGKPMLGKVTLHAVARDDQLSVTVRDDGAGIDWDALGASGMDGAKQLDALTRAGSSAREVTEVAGRGVGLSAVRKVVEGLGGCIVVHSEKGRGTDVTATVPAPGVFRVIEADFAATGAP